MLPDLSPVLLFFFISNVNVRRCLYFDLGLPEEPRVSEVRESFDVCLFLENRDIKKGAMIARGTRPEAKLGFFQGWAKFSTLTLLRLPNRFQAGEIGVDCFLVSM